MTFDELFSAATGNPPYVWQRALTERDHPARAIDAPTGAGKTEAVLLDWLWRRRFHADDAVRRSTPRRLVLALPMRTLVEQPLARVQTALERLEQAGALSRGVGVQRSIEQ